VALKLHALPVLICWGLLPSEASSVRSLRRQRRGSNQQGGCTAPHLTLRTSHSRTVIRPGSRPLDRSTALQRMHQWIRPTPLLYSAAGGLELPRDGGGAAAFFCYASCLGVLRAQRYWISSIASYLVVRDGWRGGGEGRWEVLPAPPQHRLGDFALGVLCCVYISCVVLPRGCGWTIQSIGTGSTPGSRRAVASYMVLHALLEAWLLGCTVIVGCVTQ
jgi:hypothetical protein